MLSVAAARLVLRNLGTCPTEVWANENRLPTRRDRLPVVTQRIQNHWYGLRRATLAARRSEAHQGVTTARRGWAVSSPLPSLPDRYSRRRKFTDSVHTLLSLAPYRFKNL